jgi:phage baseplate assembly protein W
LRSLHPERWKWRIDFFDEGEREIKTGFGPWLGKAIDEMADVHALTVAIREAVKNGTMRHEARMAVLVIHAMESNDTEVQRDRLHRLKLMLSEDVASDKIHQGRTKPKRRSTNKGPEEEEGVRATVNFAIKLFCS